MNFVKLVPIATIAFVALTIHTASADILVPAVPYTEHFNTTADWSTTAFPTETAPTFVPSGGASGSYVSNTLSLTGAPDLPPNLGGPIPVVPFRAEDDFGSSDHKFENNWIAGGLNELSFYVRHNAPEPLAFFARFAKGTGGAGVNFISTPLAANANWTKITFSISPSSPEFVPEGLPSLFGSVMSDVGRLQIGFPLPSQFGLYPDAFTYELDEVAWNTPEPASWTLLTVAGLSFGFTRRSKRETP